jgi:hypothetical protein
MESHMTSTSSAVRRRAVLLLAGTAIAILGSAAPAFAEPTAPTKPTPTPTRTVPPPRPPQNFNIQDMMDRYNQPE